MSQWSRSHPDADPDWQFDALADEADTRRKERKEQAERIHHTGWLQRWADAVAADEEKALVRNLSLAILLAFVCAVGLWLLAWAIR